MSPRNPLAALALAGMVAGQTLPYNPSRILLQRNGSLAYIFQPSQDQPGQSRFLSLDLSQTISNDNAPFTTYSDTLPFLDEGKQIPFTPMMDTANGHIVAVTGDCAEGADGIKIYTLVPEQDAQAGNGTWREQDTSSKDIGEQGDHAGANFLAAGMAFSGYTNGSISDSTLYLFGGMCPFANSTDETWTSNGNYSNMMLTMAAQSANLDDLDYNIDLAPGRGPPIAEAGFTITGLPPTFSDTGDDNPQYQQQDFVLLGGHTQAAFINMSQVALFSLPQESWTFLPVTQPNSGKADLATRQDVQEVEPRSGHTAVLSEDGASVIVFGGWVGDISTPAQPQLAVLRFGAGFGGRAGWTWTVPEQTDNGMPGASGIYGHGATMLPGGVMMIVGGYSIPDSASKMIRRDTQFNDKVMLYNTTSNSWIDSYTQPKESPVRQESEKPGALSKSSQRAGLGVGITFLVLLLIALIMFYFWYTRKLKREREERARDLLSRGSDGSFGQPFLEKGAFEGQNDGPSVIGDYWQNPRPNDDPYGWTQPQTQQVGNTTGLFTDKPSPTRGLRKGAPHKNYQYQPAPHFDEQRMSHGSGIHPIAEHEDEDAISRLPSINPDASLTEAQKQLREVERVLAPQRESQRWSDDPFRDPEPNPLGSHPYNPLDRGDTVRRVPTNASYNSPTRRKHNPWDLDGVPNWTSEYRPDEPLLLHSTGRISPSRSDDRTSSTLSEQSHRSAASTNSITRTMSTRTGAILAAATAAAARTHSRSPDRHSFSDAEQQQHTPNRARTNTDPSIHGPDADSFTTARTSFVALQSEGEALLGGRPNPGPNPQPPTTTFAPPQHPDLLPAPLSTSTSNNNPARKPRPQGLIGSLRRAIGAISHPETRSFSLTASSSKPAYPSPTSPTRPATRPPAPRRAASDGGHLLRQKRGRKDWLPDPGAGAGAESWEPYRDTGDWGPSPPSPPAQEGAGGEEEDWDVEDAAAQRDVQVMFTVPKTRLRVVNDDMDRASLRSASASEAVSRSGSVASAGSRTGAGAGVRARGSRSVLRVVSEGGLRGMGEEEYKD